MRLAKLVSILEHLPDAAGLWLPTAELRELVHEVEVAAGRDDETGLAPEPDAGALVDLSGAQAGRLLDRKPSTIRNWCGSGLIMGAYRLNRREWRIPREAIRAFQDRHLAQTAAPIPRRKPVDIGAWRRIGKPGG